LKSDSIPSNSFRFPTSSIFVKSMMTFISSLHCTKQVRPTKITPSFLTYFPFLREEKVIAKTLHTRYQILRIRSMLF
jgi:hypothetical protein